MSLLDTSPAGLDRRVDTCQGSVRVDGIDMHRLAWELFDLTPLFGEPNQRGENRLLPYSPGLIAYAPRKTQTRFTLPLLICGHWDMNDDWVGEANLHATLAENKAYLNANVLLPTGAGGGTRTFEWTAPNGDVVTSEIQVLPAQPPVEVPEAAVLVTTFEFVAPFGDLHL